MHDTGFEMPNDNVIVEKETPLLRGFFHVDQITLRHRKHDGAWSESMDRLLLRRPDAVCAVVHNTDHNSCYFVRQFRVGANDKEYGWMTELAAGLVDEGETAEEACEREIEEELGFRVGRIQLLTSFFTSPAILSERIYLYYVSVTDALSIHDGGGVGSEHEDIDIIEVPVSDLQQFLYEHPIRDGKTMIGMLIFMQFLGGLDSMGPNWALKDYLP